MRDIMGMDQYGQAYHALGKYPRKELLRRLERTHADKLYRDTKDGKSEHIGYVIAGRWIELYVVSFWTGKDDNR